MAPRTSWCALGSASWALSAETSCVVSGMAEHTMFRETCFDVTFRRRPRHSLYSAAQLLRNHTNHNHCERNRVSFTPRALWKLMDQLACAVARVMMQLLLRWRFSEKDAYLTMKLRCLSSTEQLMTRLFCHELPTVLFVHSNSLSRISFGPALTRGLSHNRVLRPSSRP